MIDLIRIRFGLIRLIYNTVESNLRARRMSDARAAAVLRLDAVGPRAEPPLEGRGHAGQRDPVSAEAAARRDRRALGHCDRHLRLDAIFPAARRPHRHRLRGHSALLRAHLSPAAPTRGQRAQPTHLALLREHSGYCFILALFPLVYFVVSFLFLSIFI